MRQLASVLGTQASGGDILPDLRLYAGLHGFFRQRHRPGVALILHRHGNIERRVGIDAYASVGRRGQVASARRGLYPARACARRHDARHYHNYAGHARCQTRGLESQDKRLAAYAPLRHRHKVQDHRQIPQWYRSRAAGKDHFLVVQDACPGRQAGLHVHRLAVSEAKEVAAGDARKSKGQCYAEMRNAVQAECDKGGDLPIATLQVVRTVDIWSILRRRALPPKRSGILAKLSRNALMTLAFASASKSGIIKYII